MKATVSLVIVVILFAGLFILIKPKNSSQTMPVSRELQEKVFEIVVKDKKVVSGPATLQVTEGDRVVIKITADEPEEFHLHAYDNSVDLEANIEAQISFTATLTGRFPFELEESKTDIGVLEVSPK